MAAALLIGPITHARQEWDSLSSLLTLKVASTWFPVSYCMSDVWT